MSLGKLYRGSLAEEGFAFADFGDLPPVEDVCYCPEGKAALRMAPRVKNVGLIHIPDEMQDTHRPDVGVCVGSGCELEVGSVCLVKYGTGMRVEKWDGEYDYCFVGCAGGVMVGMIDMGEPNMAAMPVDWSESVIATYEDGWRPSKGKVKIKLDRVGSVGKIAISEEYVSSDAVVVSVGSGVDPEITPGKTVVFHLGAVDSNTLTYLGKDEAIIPAWAIYGVKIAAS